MTSAGRRGGLFGFEGVGAVPGFGGVVDEVLAAFEVGGGEGVVEAGGGGFLEGGDGGGEVAGAVELDAGFEFGEAGGRWGGFGFAEDGEDGDGFVLAFDFDEVGGAAEEIGAEAGAEGVGDEEVEAVLFGGAFEAGGGVDGVADGGEFFFELGAHVADDGFALVEADADGEGFDAAGGPEFVEFGQFFAHAEGGGGGGAGVGDEVGFGGVVAEAAPDGHDGIADEFVDAAVGFEDGLDHAVEVFVELEDELFGGEFFGEAGEAAEVGEEEGDVAMGAAEGFEVGGGLAEDLLLHVRGEVAGDGGAKALSLAAFMHVVVAEAEESGEGGAGGGEQHGDDEGALVEGVGLEVDGEGDGAEECGDADDGAAEAGDEEEGAENACEGDAEDDSPVGDFVEEMAVTEGGGGVGVDLNAEENADGGGDVVLEVAGGGADEDDFVFEDGAAGEVAVPNGGDEEFVGGDGGVGVVGAEADEVGLVGVAGDFVGDAGLIEEGSWEAAGFVGVFSGADGAAADDVVLIRPVGEVADAGFGLEVGGGEDGFGGGNEAEFVFGEEEVGTDDDAVFVFFEDGVEGGVPLGVVGGGGGVGEVEGDGAGAGGEEFFEEICPDLAGPGPAFLHELEGGGFGDVFGEGAAEVEAGFVDADDEDFRVCGGAGAVEVDLVLDPPGGFLG